MKDKCELATIFKKKKPSSRTCSLSSGFSFQIQYQSVDPCQAGLQPPDYLSVQNFQTIVFSVSFISLFSASL